MIVLRNKEFSESKKGPVFRPGLHIDARNKNGERICIPAYIDENGKLKELTEEIWKKYHPEEKKYSNDSKKKSKRLQFLSRLSGHTALMPSNFALEDSLAAHNQMQQMHDQMHFDAVNAHALASMGHPIM